ncbi:MAG: hypothetical protein ACQR33_04825 [Candidatus Saccharibacteria bacterium]
MTSAHNEEFFDPLRIPSAEYESNEPLFESEVALTTPDNEVEAPERLPFRERVSDVFRNAREDFRDSPHKLRHVAVGAGMVAMQALDRARTSVVFVPTIAVDVLQHTHSPLEAAIAAGGAFGLWSAGIGSTTVEGLTQYPKAVTSFNKDFPGVVGFFEGVLPGVEAPKDQEQISRIRRIGNRALTGLKRGGTVAGIGTAPYASTAVAMGQPRAEAHKINLNASADGATIIGAFVFGVGETIVQIANDHPLLAERIQNDAGNIKLWYGVAGAMMAQQYISKKYANWKEKRAG